MKRSSSWACNFFHTTLIHLQLGLWVGLVEYNVYAKVESERIEIK